MVNINKRKDTMNNTYAAIPKLEDSLQNGLPSVNANDQLYKKNQ